MSKRARIRREREAREAAAAEEKDRGPISEKEAVQRSRIRRAAGFTRGGWAFNSRTRREIKRLGDFREKRAKKRREKKRGRR